MTIKKYLYNINYQDYDEPLCAIEKRALFGETLNSKVFFSDVKIPPSVSPYIKHRMEIKCAAFSFEELLLDLNKLVLESSVTTIKYIKLMSGDSYAMNRKSLCNRVRDNLITSSEESACDRIYGLACYENHWFFGVLDKNDGHWRAHNKRPHTYSNSLKINMAKVLINIAGGGDISKNIIDPCCGAGTVLLEGCFAGYKMTGSDSNEKMVNSASENLDYFAYEATMKHQRIEDIKEHYDAAIIDLPYGLYSQTTPELQQSIIRHAKGISDKVIVISSEDISDMLRDEKLTVVDDCKFLKSINRKFTRYIWSCTS